MFTHNNAEVAWCEQSGLTVAPEVGFEPTTNRLTADRSTTELLWIVSPALARAVNFAQPVPLGK